MLVRRHSPFTRRREHPADRPSRGQAAGDTQRAWPARRSSSRGATTDQVDDIYWRPYQPDAGTMLSRDRALGRRVVTTVLDLIEFSNGRYHGGAQQWTERRSQLRRYLRQTDLITGISQDVLDTVGREVPGVEAERLHRTALGVDHLAWGHDAPQPRWLKERCPDLGERPFLLVLGNDFVHKNRDFAIRVWRDVSPGRRGRSRHGRPARLLQLDRGHRGSAPGRRQDRAGPGASTSTRAGRREVMAPGQRRRSCSTRPRQRASASSRTRLRGSGPRRCSPRSVRSGSCARTHQAWNRGTARSTRAGSLTW